MNKLFNKNSTTSLTTTSQPSHRAQVAWSLCVAVAVAVVALQQVRGFHRVHVRSPANQLDAPHTLVTGKPVPLSHNDLTTTDIQLQ